MFNLIWQRLPATLAILLCALTIGVARDTAKPSPSSPATDNARSHARGPGWNAEADDHNSRSSHRRREWRHRNMEQFRDTMREELATIPALSSRIERLGEIQKRRRTLQQLRQATAAQKTNRDSVLKRFHTLLREDMELSEKARQLGAEIVDDMPRIQEQLDTRRKDLTDLLSAARDDHTSDTEESAQNLRRRLRYLEYIEHKLDDIKRHPERLDLLARVLKGVPGDDDRWSRRGPDRHNDDRTTAQKLESLNEQRQRLQRELHEVEARIDILNEDIATTGTASEI